MEKTSLTQRLLEGVKRIEGQVKLANTRPGSARYSCTSLVDERSSKSIVGPFGSLNISDLAKVHLVVAETVDDHVLDTRVPLSTLELHKAIQEVHAEVPIFVGSLEMYTGPDNRYLHKSPAVVAKKNSIGEGYSFVPLDFEI